MRHVLGSATKCGHVQYALCFNEHLRLSTPTHRNIDRKIRPGNGKGLSLSIEGEGVMLRVSVPPLSRDEWETRRGVRGWCRTNCPVLRAFRPCQIAPRALLFLFISI